MADTNKIRSEIEALDAEIRSLHTTEEGELREFTPEEQTEFDAKVAERKSKVALLARHEAIVNAEQVPERTIAPSAPAVIKTRDALEVLEDRSSTPRDLAEAATRQLDEKVTEVGGDMEHVRQVLGVHAKDRQWIAGIIARSTDEYASAWLKIVQGREHTLTQEERTVIGITTNANGAHLLPTHLDPTLILTGDLSDNVVRQLARVVTLTDGADSWNGITSAGVTASWDGEVVEVSDDSPTFGKPNIPTERAQALVQASISAVEDISGLGSDIMRMFAEAKDNLEGTAHAVGPGTNNQPTGVFTAVAAVTASRVVSTTAATIGLVDIHAVYNAVPRRFRKRSDWLANPLYTLAVKTLGTAVSASYSGDLREPTAGRILGRPVHESDDAPETQTTTALDQEILLGDFSNYVIVDRPGGMSVEYIPHLFNTANNLPDGRRAWYATWRNGGDVVNADAFRLLVDKTSA